MVDEGLSFEQKVADCDEGVALPFQLLEEDRERLDCVVGADVKEEKCKERFEDYSKSLFPRLHLL
ncbi:MAG: hypothetical protein J6X61_06365, partial [Clostridia bacterium]|nr:hypothetical protein [Clostridia bacterium]